MVKDYKESGSRSGVIFGGKFKLYTLDKQKWITFEIDANGDLLLTNQAGETAIVNLT